MSRKNYPDFPDGKFATDITLSFFDCIREIPPAKMTESLRQHIIAFVEFIKQEINYQVKAEDK